jgi:hypothetical protein
MMNNQIKLSGSGSIVKDNSLFSYKSIVRNELETNIKIRELLKKDGSTTIVSDEITNIILESNEYDRTLLTEAVNFVLNELDELRARPPSLYVIDSQTEKLVPITDELIVTPPDYLGHDGEMHKSNPIVHPAVSTALALSVHDKAKQNKAITKSKQNKATENAYTHLDVNKIVELAKEKLASTFIKIVEFSSGDVKNIEFGKEQINGIFQSSNMYFHRVQMFASTLAHKIMLLNPKECSFGKIEMKHNSKHQWYSIEVTTS